ncbi:MAG: glycosyltransferase family 2 protein [Elusimicrobiota bacterium]|jgi:glycosyltransferase involved in cell wall biosynthesis|nr:glycosyltransferase family 2 protein [Elusimicrobiota bacterium]
MKKKITVVSSAFNEEDNICELYNQVKAELSKLADKYDYEQIVVDNASTDGTLTKLKEIAAQDKNFKIIANTRNFGHIRSPYYGILQSFGDAVIYMASDLQDPPRLIGGFIKKWEEGFDIVLGKKTNSRESGLFFSARKFYYWLLDLVNDSGSELIENCTGFGLYDKKVIDQLRKMQEPYPYLRGLVCELGYKKTFVSFTQPNRMRGITKNNFYTLYDNAMIGFVNHSKVPLRLAALGGFALSAVSLLLAVIYFILKILFWNRFPMGTAPIMISLFFFSSVQLFFIGIIGEYLGAVLTQVHNRPLVIEKERINF